MNPENKQRIIGIVVLAAFIALLVPFLFTSRTKKQQEADNVLNDTSELAVPTTAVNNTLSQLPEVQTNVGQLLPGASADTQNASGPVLPQSADQTQSVGGDSTAVPALADTASQTNLPLPRVDAANYGISQTNAQVQVAKTPAALPETTENTVEPVKSVQSKSAKVSSKKVWSVQVGSFTEQARVNKLIASLRSKGYKVFSQKINTSAGPMTRVLVGREPTKQKAKALAAQLKTHAKIAGYLVTIKP